MKEFWKDVYMWIILGIFASAFAVILYGLVLALITEALAGTVWAVAVLGSIILGVLVVSLCWSIERLSFKYKKSKVK